MKKLQANFLRGKVDLILSQDKLKNLDYSILRNHKPSDNIVANGDHKTYFGKVRLPIDKYDS